LLRGTEYTATGSYSTSTSKKGNQTVTVSPALGDDGARRNVQSRSET
jgi:hypothetical protein